jgi:hypothetical protein
MMVQCSSAALIDGDPDVWPDAVETSANITADTTVASFFII